MEKIKKIKLTELNKSSMNVLIGGGDPVVVPSCPACSSCDAISNRGYMHA